MRERKSSQQWAVEPNGWVQLLLQLSKSHFILVSLIINQGPLILEHGAGIRMKLDK